MGEIQQGFTKSNSITLGLFTLAYVVEEMAHFIIGSMSREMAQDIHFGDQKCYDEDFDAGFNCNQYENEELCEAANNGTIDDDVVCYWDYSGQGIEYQILAGTVFVVVFTFSGVIMGYLGDKVIRYSRDGQGSGWTVGG